MIRAYPNKLTLDLDGLCEEYVIDRRMTVAALFNMICKDPYERGDFMPFSVKVDGEIIDEDQWWDFYVLPKDDVIICIEPRGTVQYHDGLVRWRKSSVQHAYAKATRNTKRARSRRYSFCWIYQGQQGKTWSANP